MFASGQVLEPLEKPKEGLMLVSVCKPNQMGSLRNLPAFRLEPERFRANQQRHLWEQPTVLMQKFGDIYYAQ